MVDFSPAYSSLLGSGKGRQWNRPKHPEQLGATTRTGGRLLRLETTSVLSTTSQEIKTEKHSGRGKMAMFSTKGCIDSSVLISRSSMQELRDHERSAWDVVS